MKKIVSIVLALVLVLAIAAPAMAITGYVSPITQKTASAPFALELSLVSDDAAGLGLLGLTAPIANKAYVMNEVIYGRVDIAANPKTTWATYDWGENGGTYLNISSNAAVLLHAIPYEISSASSSVLLPGGSGSVVAGSQVDAVKNVIQWQIPDMKNFTVLFTGVVQAQGSIVAELLGGNKEYFAGIKGALSTTEYFIYNDLGEVLYTIQKDANNSVIVAVYENGAVLGHVAFGRDAKNICTTIVVSAAGKAGEVVYSAPISNGGAIVESIAGITAADTTGAFKALKAVYDEVMAFFGFDYNAKGELLDAHFTSKLHSFYAKDEVAVNLYTAAITVPDADVEIPQTGDAATTIGFVMVAMAIVAAAAVAYKKVRA